MKTHFLFILLLSFLSTKIFATISSDGINHHHNTALGLNLSTNGMGAEISKSLGKKQQFNIRFEARYLLKQIKNQESYLVPYNTQYVYIVNGKIQKGSIGILFDYFPFSNGWKITAGLTYLLNNVENVAKPRDTVYMGSIAISPDEVGTLTYKYKLTYAPYLGIGWRKVLQNSAFALHLELGAYYHKFPLTNLKGTGMYEPLNITKSDYPMPIDAKSHAALPILPVANLGLTMRLGKIPN